MRSWHLLTVAAVLFAADAITDPAGRWLSAVAAAGFTVSAILAARGTRKENER